VSDIVRLALERAVGAWQQEVAEGESYDAARPIPPFFTLETLAIYAGPLAKDIAETRADVTVVRNGLFGLLPLKKPIPMRLFCEVCHTQHIDAGEFATKPHHTHACQFCGLTWRPSVEFTVGVQFLPGFKDMNAIVEPAGGAALELEASKARERMLSEIDSVLHGTEHWQGGRLDTIKHLVSVVGRLTRSGWGG
jgi:hypothetical protein